MTQHTIRANVVLKSVPQSGNLALLLEMFPAM